MRPNLTGVFGYQSHALRLPLEYPRGEYAKAEAATYDHDSRQDNLDNLDNRKG